MTSYDQVMSNQQYSDLVTNSSMCEQGIWDSFVSVWFEQWTLDCVTCSMFVLELCFYI